MNMSMLWIHDEYERSCVPHLGQCIAGFVFKCCDLVVCSIALYSAVQETLLVFLRLVALPPWVLFLCGLVSQLLITR